VLFRTAEVRLQKGLKRPEVSVTERVKETGSKVIEKVEETGNGKDGQFIDVVTY